MIAIDNLCRVITSFLAGLVILLVFSPASLHAAQSWPVSRLSALHTDWSIADFDGDQQPDVAIADSAGTGYRVSLRLSATGESSQFDIQFSQLLPGERSALTLRAQDVDGDRDLDLVITSGISRRPVGIWLNDGSGNFTQSDASLYPARIWRAPPVLFSRSEPGQFPDAIPEQSRSISWSVRAFEVYFGRLSGQQIRAGSRAVSPFLTGPWRVRPPPAV